MAKVVKKVLTRNLAFWENLVDTIEDEPTRYLKQGDTVSVYTERTVYGGRFGDREYYKVYHPTYGSGYVLREGVGSVAGN